MFEKPCGHTTALTIRTRYVTRPNSNVGGYRATGLGKQRTLTCDQALSSDENHRRAAQALADLLGNIQLSDQTDSSEDGLRRTFTAKVV